MGAVLPQPGHQTPRSVVTCPGLGIAPELGQGTGPGLYRSEVLVQGKVVAVDEETFSCLT
ncbi:MAG TPA: hypothetical protein PK640_17320 [Verrucomicrobiota bacterium]|nr:hypothetical protein [Verrucomicrobiota bacterium]